MPTVPPCIMPNGMTNALTANAMRRLPRNMLRSIIMSFFRFLFLSISIRFLPMLSLPNL